MCHLGVHPKFHNPMTTLSWRTITEQRSQRKKEREIMPSIMATSLPCWHTHSVLTNNIINNGHYFASAAVQRTHSTRTNGIIILLPKYIDVSGTLEPLFEVVEDSVDKKSLLIYSLFYLLPNFKVIFEWIYYPVFKICFGIPPGKT